MCTTRILPGNSILYRENECSVPIHGILYISTNGEFGARRACVELEIKNSFFNIHNTKTYRYTYYYYFYYVLLCGSPGRSLGI